MRKGGHFTEHRFSYFTQDVKNSTILNDAVYGISMGARISNLTDKINLRFKTERLVSA